MVANPQFKTITVYDSDLKRLDTRQGKDQKESQGQAQLQSKNVRKENTAEEEPAAEIKENKKRRKSQSL